MSTYSINIGTPYESSFEGILDPNHILNKIPNNTSQLVVPKSVRDSLFTIWDNISFKKINTGASVSIPYIGIGSRDHLNDYISGGSDNGLKILMGKPMFNGDSILNDNLLDYDISDVDFFFYNSKPDGFGNPHNQFTKVAFLAGNSASLFDNAPYILSQENVGATAIDLTIHNDGGKIIIDSNEEIQIGSPTTKITLISGSGSSGIKTLPAGLPGDIQLNLDNCDFGFVEGLSASGSSANVGNVLLLGSGNKPYWGSLHINSIFTLNQVLGSGNESDGNNLIMSTDDIIYLGDTGLTGSLYNDGTDSFFNSENIKIRAGSSMRLDIGSVTPPNSVLKTDSSGFLKWANDSALPGGSSSNIQFNDSNSFGGTNDFKWDNVNQSVKINGANQNHSLSLKPNSSGGIYINGAVGSTGEYLHIRESTTDVLKILSSDRSIIMDSTAIYNFSFGSDGTFNKFTFNNSSSSDPAYKKHITLTSTANTTGTNNNQKEEFRIDYKDRHSNLSSTIAMSPANQGGMYIGTVNTKDEALFLGDHTNSTTPSYSASMVIYPQPNSISSILDRSESKSVVIGNSVKKNPTPGTTMNTTDDKRALGINIVPEVDSHLNGVHATVPRPIVLPGDGIIENIDSSYLIITDPVGATLKRIGIHMMAAPFGTTIRMWNATTSPMTIDSYPSPNSNIFIDVGSYVLQTNGMLELVYLPTEVSGLVFPHGFTAINENGLWHKVN